MANLIMTSEGAALQLPCGAITLFDIDDYEILSKFAWHLSSTGYAIAKTKGSYKERKTITMHSFLIENPAGFIVDHINRNRLDNRKKNLRSCIHAENMLNIGKKKSKTGGRQSKYRGVSWSATRDRWQVVVRTGGKLKHLGVFRDEQDAADIAAPYFNSIFHGTN